MILGKPKEIGAYVGYSAMNLARTVRQFGGRVASLEVDPLHVTLVRNMLEYAGLSEVVDVWTGYSFDSIPHLLQKYGPKSVDMVFMDQKGTRFHSDLALMEELDLLSDHAVVLADNVLKPGAPQYLGSARRLVWAHVRGFVNGFQLAPKNHHVFSIPEPIRQNHLRVTRFYWQEIVLNGKGTFGISPRVRTTTVPRCQCGSSCCRAARLQCTTPALRYTYVFLRASPPSRI